MTSGFWFCIWRTGESNNWAGETFPNDFLMDPKVYYNIKVVLYLKWNEQLLMVYFEKLMTQLSS